MQEGMPSKLYRFALALALVTFFYNILEGLVSVYFGAADETATLFGFGIDSFIESLSAAGVLHMLLRLRLHPDAGRDRFERTALRVTGTSFYLLAAGLATTGAWSIATGHRPETTLWGLVISLVSIAAMLVLVHYKTKVGRELSSSALLADAACTRVCIYMSVVLLAASLLYALTGIGYVDAAGALGIAWLSFREGKESFEKAAGASCCCGDCHTTKERGIDQ